MLSPLAISSSAWFLLSLGVLLFFYGIGGKRNRSKLPLPPGPPKLPLVGNLFDMPSERQWETYSKWSRECNSDIIHVDAGGTSIVVLSSMEAIRELFERRSSLYSDRPRLPMLNELMGWDFAIGDNWRSHRKIFHEAFNVGAAKHFYSQERAAAHGLLRRLLQDPHNVTGHLRNMAGALVMDVTYGIDVHRSNYPYIELAQEAMEGLATASLPGRFLVDTIPALKYVPGWFPGAQFQRQAKQWKKAARELLEIPFAQTKRDIATGNAVPSFTSRSLGTLHDAKNEEKGAKETIIQATAANMYAAGTDTTASALGTFILAMLTNPEAQKKAQAELDSVLGADHLPDFTDEPSLPYVCAVLKEVLRWRNALPIAVPHYLQVEDEYRGYRIPANTIVIGSTWAILHDEVMYPDPHTFKPERFLLNGKLNPDVRDPETVAFGFGRRICPGRHMAASSLWITIASLLATFDIQKAVDEYGKEIEPSHEYFPGLISGPLPFECSITPRSRQAEESIRATSVGP
ncbi:cytochrome P450 [Mycena vulgaris]|nr:cytochrome P450 [Mycena vulgaris]